eukprot:403364035
MAVCAAMLGVEADLECLDQEQTKVDHWYREALICLIVVHLFQIIKSFYYAVKLKSEQNESFLKCCLSCTCCYTLGIAVFVQVVYFKYDPICRDALPGMNTWLRAEVIIFYSYILLELLQAIIMCRIMIIKHKKKLEKDAELLKDQHEKLQNQKNNQENQIHLPPSQQNLNQKIQDNQKNLQVLSINETSQRVNEKQVVNGILQGKIVRTNDIEIKIDEADENVQENNSKEDLIMSPSTDNIQIKKPYQNIQNIDNNSRMSSNAKE